MTRSATARAIGALVTVLALSAVGCGGSGRLSARDYVGQANEICARADHRMARVRFPGIDGSRASWHAAAYLAEVQDEAAAELSDLRPPSRFAQFDTVWVALVRQGASELRRMTDSLRRGELDAAADEARAVARLTGRADALAETYGIASCAGPVFAGPVLSGV
jgi:hypothetical protein